MAASLPEPRTVKVSPQLSYALNTFTMTKTPTQTPTNRVRFSPTAPANSTIPHVVRVTFLGAAGIVHTTCTNGNGVDDNPTKLRVAASISRNRTARGITSGLSGGLRRVPRETAAPSVKPPSQVMHTRSNDQSVNPNRTSSLSLTLEEGRGSVEICAELDRSASIPAPAVEEDGPGRYVAVWERKTDRTSKTNTLAFEAELHPGGNEENDAFAPKTFCLTLGLAAADTADVLPIAIPLGCADLVITGKETLDGNPIQLDLPLSSLNAFQRGLESEKMVPLLDLTDGSAAATGKKEDVEATSARGEMKQSPKTPKHKKSMVSRIFSRKTNSSNLQQENIPEEVTLDQISIFQRQNPPTSAERTHFLQKYAIDPSGDAVLRIGLEVFQRGSELEKVFRMKNRIRREELRRRMERRDDDAVDGGDGVNAYQSEIARTTSGTPSLVDNVDSSDSDEMSSYASLDSECSGTTWDESTFYTNGTSYSETDTSYSTEFVSDSSYKRGNANSMLLGRMFDCKLDHVKEDGSLSNDSPTSLVVTEKKKQTFPMQMRTLLNFNCAAGNKLDLVEYSYDEVPRGIIRAPIISKHVPSSEVLDGMEGEEVVHDDCLKEENGECKDEGNEITLDSLSINPSKSHDPELSKEQNETGVIEIVGNKERPPDTIELNAQIKQSTGEASQSAPEEETEGLELTLEDVNMNAQLGYI